MADTLPHRLTEDISGTGPHANSDPVVSAREMEAHTAKAIETLRFLDVYDDPRNATYGPYALRAQVHATLALAWATRLTAAS